MNDLATTFEKLPTLYQTIYGGFAVAFLIFAIRNFYNSIIETRNLNKLTDEIFIRLESRPAKRDHVIAMTLHAVVEAIHSFLIAGGLIFSSYALHQSVQHPLVRAVAICFLVFGVFAYISITRRLRPLLRYLAQYEKSTI